MRLFTVAAVFFSFALTSSLQAHHPEWKQMPIHPRIDVIGPIGSSFKPSYRRRYNRPSKWVGRLMYYIAPSSQEAMAWHDAEHRGLYEHHRPRVERHYFFPKPWEGLSQAKSQPPAMQESSMQESSMQESSMEEILPVDDGSTPIEAPVDLRTEELGDESLDLPPPDGEGAVIEGLLD